MSRPIGVSRYEYMRGGEVAKVIVAIFLAPYVSCSFDYGMIGEEVGREGRVRAR